MATTTAWGFSLLDEAAAIVEAEWIRLQQDVAFSGRGRTDLTADLPAPRPAPPGIAVTTTPRRWPSQAIAHDCRGWPLRPWPATSIWATQRSPPSLREELLKDTVEQGR